MWGRVAQKALDQRSRARLAASLRRTRLFALSVASTATRAITAMLTSFSACTLRTMSTRSSRSGSKFTAGASGTDAPRTGARCGPCGAGPRGLQPTRALRSVRQIPAAADALFPALRVYRSAVRTDRKSRTHPCEARGAHLACSWQPAFQAPDLKFVPLADAINRVRTVPATSVFVQIARSLGIALGD
jgi:hypothetical protein